MINQQIADLYEKISGEESTALGKLLSKIPGLSGYMERGRRREADQILRETIAARLEQVRLHLAAVTRDLSRDISVGILYSEDVGAADTLLMGLIGKIKDAPQGYAGFFDAIKVKEEDLARLYYFDEQMLNHVDQLTADVAALQKAAEENLNIGGAISELEADLRLANQTFDRRNEVLMGISSTKG